MKKFVRSLVIATAFAAGTGAIVATAPTLAVAQTKDAPKGVKPADPKEAPKVKPVEPKPTDPKAVAPKGSVVIKPDTNSKFRFSIHDENGKTLMMSPVGYATEDEAMKMLEVAKAIFNGSKVTKEKAEVNKDK